MFCFSCESFWSFICLFFPLCVPLFYIFGANLSGSDLFLVWTRETPPTTAAVYWNKSCNMPTATTQSPTVAFSVPRLCTRCTFPLWLFLAWHVPVCTLSHLKVKIRPDSVRVIFDRKFEMFSHHRSDHLCVFRHECSRESHSQSRHLHWSQSLLCPWGIWAAYRWHVGIRIQQLNIRWRHIGESSLLKSWQRPSAQAWRCMLSCVVGLPGPGGWRRKHLSRYMGECVYDASAGEWYTAE